MFGASRVPGAPSQQEIHGLCEKAAASMGIHDAHVAIEFVDAERIQELNAEHRNRLTPTDVLSFPIDGVEPLHGAALASELGDIVICPQHTVDLREAIVHGMLHLLGMDHETDDGEMLTLQDALLAGTI